MSSGVCLTQTGIFVGVNPHFGTKILASHDFHMIPGAGDAHPKSLEPPLFIADCIPRYSLLKSPKFD